MHQACGAGRGGGVHGARGGSRRGRGARGAAGERRVLAGFLPGASGVCVRSLAARRQRGPAGQVPVVTATERPAPRQREHPESASARRVPPGPLPGAVQYSGEPQFQCVQPHLPARSLVQSPLHRGGEGAG